MNKVIVVSNRLPVTAKLCQDNTWSFKQSSGGLVAALTGLQNEHKFIWAGWLGNSENVFFFLNF